jgi:hypothetical protein
MSLFATIFLAVIVGMPILITWKMNRHEDGSFRLVTTGFGVVFSLFIYTTMAPMLENVVSFGDFMGMTETVTVADTYNVTESYNSTETSADIMSMLNKAPENTSKYWDNDWAKVKQ